MNKEHIFILVLLCSCHFQIGSFAQQSIQYTYNPSGNRTERNMVLLPPKNPDGDNYSGDQEYKYEEQEEEYTDVLNNHEITIFPNPNGGQFDVQITNLSEVMESSLILYSVDGKEVFYRNRPDEITHINISRKKKGTYVLKILLDGVVSSWKIVKQ